ncbi:MAG: cytochrome b5-like heme/steroid binding domain-containing protein, partial [Olpidium bornovanus]
MTTGDAQARDPARPFTWQELATHNTRQDAYVAVRGKVYDVTEFISRHPGGEDTLLLAAGRDATLVSAYCDQHNLPAVWMRYAFIYETLFASYYVQFFVPFVAERLLLQAVFAVVLGLACAQHERGNGGAIYNGVVGWFERNCRSDSTPYTTHRISR